VFAEFERSMISERVKAGLARTTERLGRPPIDDAVRQSVVAMLNEGIGVREAARQTGLSATSVSRMKQSILSNRLTSLTAS
jgi:DNA invertase Pin-like site-specific DNA recombinase